MSDDDDSNLLPRQALQATVLDLKKQALSYKQQGNVTEALALLKQAKALEAASACNLDDDAVLLPPLYWKKLALLYKQQGNVEQAKLALLRFKRAESEEAVVLATPPGVASNEEPSIAAASATPSPSSAPASTTANDKDNAIQNDGDDDAEMDLAMMTTDDNNIAATSASSSLLFTRTEMMDHDMMTEFQQAGMPVPTLADYDAHILESKKAALQHKQQGDIAKATQQLRVAKQLEAVKAALQQQQQQMGTAGNTMGNNNDDNNNQIDNLDAWMGSLNAEENELLKELFEESASGGDVHNDEEGLLNATAAPGEALSVEEIESMDDRDLLDFIDMMGRSSLPTVAQLCERATQQQQRAIEYKQSNNLDKAKLALLDSKRAKAQAGRLEAILAKLDGGVNTIETSTKDVSLDDLEALMDGPKKVTVPPKPKTQPPSPVPSNPWLLKPSAEIKAEVLRLKNAKQIKEATQLLQTLKSVLQAEHEKAEAATCSQLKESLTRQLEVCEIQLRLWQYYVWFVDPTVGLQEQQKWTKYSEDCKKGIRALETTGSSALKIGTSSAMELRTLEDDVLGIAERGLYASHETKNSSPSLVNDLEVCVLRLYGLETNEKLQRALKKEKKTTTDPHSGCLTMRIDTKIQLPLRSDDPTNPVSLQFRPTSQFKQDATQFDFGFDVNDSKQPVKLPNRDSKEWKTLVRRMESKAVQFSVFLTHEPLKQNKAQNSSWFFGRAADKVDKEPPQSQENSEVLLGKVSIELNTLLDRTCTADDYPLMMNGKATGGKMRASLRLFPPINAEKGEFVSKKHETVLYTNALAIELRE